jgi:transposase
MRTASKIVLTKNEKEILTAFSRSGKIASRLVERSKIVLLASEGFENQQIGERLGISRQKAGRWRDRYFKSRLLGIEKDAPRSGRIPAIDWKTKTRIVNKTLQELPTTLTHWSRRTMAKASGLSASTIGRIWSSHGIKPHLVKTFKLSNDPNFVEKLEDIVGLYLNPPEHALVFSCDEKSQVQALDRTQPGLPLKKGRAQTMTHDYKRNGTTSLFAAMNTLDGSIISQCMKRHRHIEWLNFLRLIKSRVPKEKEIHMICDNYATHKHPLVKAWLEKNPRFHIHFTPTSSSWLNMVERFFRDITENRIRRGVFRSVLELEKAIDDYIAAHNQNPKPFVWTAKASDILEKVKRGRAKLNKLQSV